MLRMQELFPLDGWFEIGYLVNDASIFVKGKEHLLSKDSSENIAQWREKRFCSAN